MDTNRKVFEDSSSTLRAELRCVFGRNFHYFSPSLFRFKAKYVEETEPCNISHRPIKGSVTVPGIHALNADGIIASNKPISGLEVEVSPLVVDFLVGSGNNHLSLLPAFRAFLSAREPLLSHFQGILRPLKEARVLNFLSRRCSQE